MDPIEPTCRGVAAPRAALVVSLVLAGATLAIFPPACASGGSSGEGGGPGTTTHWTTSSGGHAGTGGTSTGGTGGTGAEAGTGGTGGTSTGGTGGTSTGGTGGSTGGSGGTSTGGSGGTSTGGSGGSGGGGLVAYSHSITIDGVNDFTPGAEDFTSTSVSPNLYKGYVSWDATYLYVGMSGVDVGSGSSSYWVLVYIGGSPWPPTGQGQPYAGGQLLPTLPFHAHWHIRWKADNTYTNTEIWNGAAWADAGWLWNDGVHKVHQTGNFVEMRIPRADIGNPTTVDLHISMIDETGVWTYAGVPATSFIDGANPLYAHYFQFDLSAAQAPNSYSPL